MLALYYSLSLVKEYHNVYIRIGILCNAHLFNYYLLKIIIK